MEVSAFECNVRGQQWQQIINHLSAGKARYAYLLDVRDAWPDLTFADITVRKVGRPVTSDAFRRNAAYRGRPAPAAVPPGHVVVPVNPPDWLLFHLMDAVWYSVEGDIEITKTEARSIYRKFIAASQEKT